MAIGKLGQNILLASRLVGRDIHLVKKEEREEMGEALVESNSYEDQDKHR
ncbi:MAG: hypothetical protein WBQ73_03165 [Candidatus Babeliales bacterium]